MFKVNNKDTRSQRHHSGVTVNFEFISHIILKFLLLTLKQVDACWVEITNQIHVCSQQ